MARPPKPWEGSDRPTPYTVVNTRSGYPTTVLPLGGWNALGLPISLSLFHNLDAATPAYTGMKDSNWSHSFSARLVGTEHGYLLWEADGQRKEFTSSDGDTSTEDDGWFDSLSDCYYYYDTSTTFLARDVVRRNGIRLVFSEDDGTYPERPLREDDSGGFEQLDSQWTNPDYGVTLRLRRVIDRNGNTIRLAYSGDGGTGDLLSVTDANGRSLQFTHYTSSTVIEDPSGQTWTLNWGTNKSLTSVQNAASGMTTRTFAYTYNSPTTSTQRVAM